MRSIRLHIILFIMLAMAVSGVAQISQEFNQSINQVGACWQAYGMSIDTRNGPNGNTGNQKKHLATDTAEGGMLISPLIFFENPGIITFKHNISIDDGDERTLSLYLLDEQEVVIDTLFHHVYRTGGSNGGVPATTVLTDTIIINPAYISTVDPYILMWEWEATGTNIKGTGRIDDIYIDGDEFSDPNNNNGDGYCRFDEILYDTVCTWDTSVLYKVPTVIVNSTWSWEFGAPSSVGYLDSTIVPGPMDTLVEVRWKDVPGTYVVKVTEIRPLAETYTYDVTYYVTVYESPQIEIEIDTVCISDPQLIHFSFDGSGPYQVTYSDGTNTWTQVFNGITGTATLPPYTSTQTITITDFTDAGGCPPLTYPSADAVIWPLPLTGPIYHY